MITTEELNSWIVYIKEICGIHLEANKSYLIENRLATLLKDEQCKTMHDLYFKSKYDATKRIEKQVINAMTTNETLFFRDSSPFELLGRTLIPHALEARKSRGAIEPIPLKIWSAASSTGQEAWSMIMTAKETLIDLSRIDLKVLGTDISERALEQAQKAVYSKMELDRGLPKDKLSRYFVETGESWAVRDEFKKYVQFKRQNLMENMIHLGRFDIVFCRNVAIYFSDTDKTKLYERIANMLEPWGVLVIGSTESLSGISDLFEMANDGRGVYYKLKQR
jgi:chemotaxis protein methyltransferase CheR